MIVTPRTERLFSLTTQQEIRTLLRAGERSFDVGNIGVSAEDHVIRVGAQVAVTDPFGVLHPAHIATYIAGIRDAAGDAVFVTNPTENLARSVSLLQRDLRTKSGRWIRQVKRSLH